MYIEIDTKNNIIQIRTGYTLIQNAWDETKHPRDKKGQFSQVPSGNDIAPEEDINQRPYKNIYLTDYELKQVKQDVELFVKQVQSMEDGNLPKRTQLTVLREMPSAYDTIPELRRKKLLVSQDVYKKIINLPNKHNKNHNIDPKRAIKIPILVADPQYILKSAAENHRDRFVIVTGSRGGFGERLSVIIQPNTQNIIVSAYDEHIDISEEKKAKRVLYRKKEKL